MGTKKLAKKVNEERRDRKTKTQKTDEAAKHVVRKWLNEASFWENAVVDADDEPGEGNFRIIGCEAGENYARLVTVQFSVSDMSIEEAFAEMAKKKED